MFALEQADICAYKTAEPLEHNNSKSWAEQEMFLYPMEMLSEWMRYNMISYRDFSARGIQMETIYWLLDQFGNSLKNLRSQD